MPSVQSRLRRHEERRAYCSDHDRPWTTRRGSDRTDFPNAADRPEVVGVTNDRPASFERSMQARGAGRARGGRDAQGASGVAERRRSEVMRAARPEEAVQNATCTNATCQTPLPERHCLNARLKFAPRTAVPRTHMASMEVAQLLANGEEVPARLQHLVDDA